MRRARTYFQPEEDLTDRIILSVRTKGFESEVEVPVPLAGTSIEPFVTSWLNMIAEALKMPHVVTPVIVPIADKT